MKYALRNNRKCVACCTCINECPLSAISVWKGCYATVDEGKCVGCAKCTRVCPTGCIEIIKEEVK